MSLFASLQRWRTAESARKAKAGDERPARLRCAGKPDSSERWTLLFFGPTSSDAVAKQAGPKTVIPPTSADTLTLSAPAILAPVNRGATVQVTVGQGNGLPSTVILDVAATGNTTFPAI